MEQENKKICEAKRKERNEEIRVSEYELLVTQYGLVVWTRVWGMLWHESLWYESHCGMSPTHQVWMTLSLTCCELHGIAVSYMVSLFLS